MGIETVRLMIDRWAGGWGIFDADPSSTRMYRTQDGPFATKRAATAEAKTLRADGVRYVIAK